MIVNFLQPNMSFYPFNNGIGCGQGDRLHGLSPYVYSRKKESVSLNTVDNINNMRRINMKF